MTAPNDLARQLERGIGINTGKIPVHIPEDDEEIKILRICISMLRQVEEDYLSPRSSPEVIAQAELELFGMHLSILPGVCRALGIDFHDARMKLIEWKSKGLQGDPIFGFLNKKRGTHGREK